MAGLLRVPPESGLKEKDMAEGHWKHPNKGAVWNGDPDKHTEKIEQLESQGWERVMGQEDHAPWKAKKKRGRPKKKK
jgi:hypothetical protein|tara:strand:- start:170 stop:400 length:231 start_codon:yes stop_codon:yes gene_type:complete